MSNDILAVLKSIDASLKTLVGRGHSQTAQARPQSQSRQNGRQPQRPQAQPQVAPDSDLDGQYGDPVVRFLPRDWNGDDVRQLKFSETTPEFLEMLAKAYDWFAKKAEQNNEMYNGKPMAPFKRKDAARARGWANRLRAKSSPVTDDPYAYDDTHVPQTEWEG